MSTEAGSTPAAARYRAVVFDLLTALLDSGTLWTEVAGDAESARRWRKRYLDLTYGAGTYQPYETLVAQAAAESGLGAGVANRLVERYGELQPWPGVRETLAALRDAGIPLGVVTNCSERLGRIAANAIGVQFDVAVRQTGRSGSVARSIGGSCSDDPQARAGALSRRCR